MYVLALSDYKQPAAAAGYKPAPQLAPPIRQTNCSLFLFRYGGFFVLYIYNKSVLRNALRKTDVLIIVAVVREPRR